jgi:predicted DNA-binding protein YlxM (UPF0122 family)
MSGDNPWLVDYQGVWAREMEVNAVVKQANTMIEDYENKIQAWKKHADGIQKDFEDVVKQRNQRECQALAWRDVIKEVMEQHPEYTKEKINAMYDKARDGYYEMVRANGKPV